MADVKTVKELAEGPNPTHWGVVLTWNGEKAVRPISRIEEVPGGMLEAIYKLSFQGMGVQLMKNASDEVEVERVGSPEGRRLWTPGS